MPSVSVKIWRVADSNSCRYNNTKIGKGGKTLLKDSIIQYVKENTAKISLEELDTVLTAEAIAGYFQVKRNTVSYYLNQEIGKTLFKINTRPVRFLDKKIFEKNFFTVSKDIYASVKELLEENRNQSNINDGEIQEINSVEEKDVFQDLIGSNGSLKKPIEQMKTSIFYPNTSLPVFLHGPTGAGKSFMARKIYEFAVQEGILEPDAPFVIMNCAQYVNNIELLSSNLFGYVKGAFTGAYATTKGLLEAADGGMLFLDEVHRLNSESQEKLFVFLDQGIFRRMGESEGWHKAKVRMVMATTENLESNFLDTFLRRIPIVVQIPSLQERGEQERLQFIYQFFIEESKVLNKKIIVSGNVIETLLNYPYQGNIGDLENKIKFICATAYAKKKRKNEIDVHLEHLPEDVLKEIADKVENKIGNYDMVEIHPEAKVQEILSGDAVGKDYHQELFAKLISIFEEFQSQNYAKEQFEKRCIHTVNDVLDRLIYNQNSENENAMRKYIVNSVQEAFRYVEYSCNVQFGGNSLHAITAYFFYMNQNFRKQNIIIPDDFMQYILEEYQKEIHIARRILDMLSSKMDIVSRQEDLVPLTIYIRGLLNVTFSKKRPRAVILAHGYATASSVADVANRILDENIFESVDMPIEKNVSDVVEWMKEYVEKNDVSHGIILMVDMGSLREIYHSFEENLKSPLVVMNNISTQMAVMAGELIQKEEKLEHIVQILEEENKTEYKIIYPKIQKQKTILTCCITGTGTAEQIRLLIENSIPKELDVQVISYDYDQLQNTEIVKGIYQKCEVLGIVGTKNPKIGQEKFIPLEQLVSGEAAEQMIDMLRNVADAASMEKINDNLIRNFSMNRLLGFLTILDTEKILTHIEEAIKQYEFLSGRKLRNSTKINLYIHVGCLTERLIRNLAIEDYPQQEEFQKIHKKEIRKIQAAFSVIEKTYSVKIPISEIGYIYDIMTEI